MVIGGAQRRCMSASIRIRNQSLSLSWCPQSTEYMGILQHIESLPNSGVEQGTNSDTVLEFRLHRMENKAPSKRFRA